jgi:hypothetical protein
MSFAKLTSDGSAAGVSVGTAVSVGGIAVSVGGGVLVGISVAVAGISVGEETGASVGWLPQAVMRPVIKTRISIFDFIKVDLLKSIKYDTT